MAETLVAILAIAGLVAVMIPISLWFAFHAAILWGWFIVPVFNAPPLTTLQLWGVCLALSLLRPRINLQKNEDADWAGAIVLVVLGPPLTLAIGAALKFWWM